jgi:hypothetical protein
MPEEVSTLIARKYHFRQSQHLHAALVSFGKESFEPGYMLRKA